jgi:competence protein ComEC
MDKQKAGLKTGLFAMLLFTALRSYSFYRANSQQKIIFYNVQQHMAIDFIDGRNYFFKSDSSLLKDDFLQNLHIKPSRILYRLKPADHSGSFIISGNYAQFGPGKFIIIDSNFNFEKPVEPVRVNALILAFNPKIYLKQLTGIIQPDIILFDASNPAWKIKYWIKDCESMGIPYHNVSENGAYVMNIK